MSQRRGALAVCAAALVCVFNARMASAQTTTPACTSLPNPIIIDGSSAVKTYIGYLSAAMAAQATPATLIYSAPGSCAGVAQLIADVNPTASCASQTGACATGTGSYFTAPTTDGGMPVSNSCTFDATGDHADLAVSDAFLSTCTMDMPPSGFTDTNGPIESMAFVTPIAATGQQALTAQEGYFVFGFPNADGITGTSTPWTNDMDLIIRSPTSGTEVVLAGEVGVPPTLFQGVQESGSSTVSSGLAALMGADVDKGLGILGIDYIELNPGHFNILAFQAFGQTAAYWPNSTPTTLDKQNVRDGHYLPWGYAHFITRNAATGTGATPNGQAVLNLINGTTQIAGFTPGAAAIGAHYVPQCAMTVERVGDYPALTPYSDPHPCECYFEATATGTAPAACTACTSNTSCPSTAPVCTYGFCEPR